MAIKTDRLGTAFTFSTLAQLYGVTEVLGLLYQWPWVRWNCSEMAVTLGEDVPGVCGSGKYGWTFSSCKAFKVCNQLPHIHVQYILSHTHTHTHLTRLHINMFWQGQDCDCKDVSVSGGECALDENQE